MNINAKALGLIESQAPERPFPPVRGKWFDIGLRPFLTCVDTITVGVGFVDESGLLHGRVIEDLSRLRCLYDERVDLASFCRLLSMLNGFFGGSKTTTSDARLLSPNITFGEPKFAAGNSIAEIVNRVFTSCVQIAAQRQQLPQDLAKFTDHYAPKALRDEVFAHLQQRLSPARWRSLVQFEPLRISDGGEEPVSVQIPFRAPGLVGTLASAWYKTAWRAELNVVRAGMALHAVGHAMPTVERMGLFVLRPDVGSGFNQRQLREIDRVIDNTFAELKAGGIHIGVDDHTAGLADQVAVWSEAA